MPMDPKRLLMFLEAMAVVDRNRDSLSDYNLNFLGDMRGAWELMGDNLEVSRRQFEHMRGLAVEFRE